MSSVAKLAIVSDVEYRIVEEIKNIEEIKARFMKGLSEYTARCRDVRFSEILYDESLDHLVTVTEHFSREPV